MSGIVGNNIVRNGLVVHLDAADIKSYPGSGNIWFDRSGNRNNATLTNGPTFNSGNGGYFSFDGVDDYVQTNYNQNTSDKSLTWEAWFWDNSAGGFFDNTAIISNYGANATTPFTMLHINSSGHPFFGQRNSSGTENYQVYSTNICDGIWHHIVGVVAGANMYIYVDGILRTGGASVSGTTQSGQNIVIGSNHLERYQSCRIAIVRIYDNRALSASEILQNFNATRKRFNI